MILLFVASAFALADEEAVREAKDMVCKKKFDEYESLNKYGEDLYGKWVDGMMCSTICPCQGTAETQKIWADKK